MKTMKNGMRAIHPGEILREEFLIPMGITAHALSLSLQVPATRISELIHERRGITADTALRLSKYFGTTHEFWLNLQMNYDTKKARETLADVLDHIQPLRMAHS